MPALSALDAAMFLLESKNRPFAVGPLVVLQPGPKERRGFADRLVSRMLERPVKAPFDYKLKLSPRQMPSVDSVAGVDPAAHVHRHTLHGEATLDELFTTVGKLQVQLLDRSRPLWELHVIDGLEDGRVALYGKVHHGIIDGRGLIQLMSQWLSADPGETAVRAMWDGLPRPAAARTSLVKRLLGLLDKAGSLVGSTRGLARLLARRGVASLGLMKGLPLPFLGVPKVLAGKVSTRRSYAYCVLDVREMKALGKAHGATINDVFLTVLDIAMQRYLRERGTLPRKPLVVDMPLALAGADGGNQIAVMQFPLGKPSADFGARLAAVRENTALLKEETSRQSQDAVMLYTALSHAYPSLFERIGLGRPVRLANMVVSNPFGLSKPHYLMGAEVELLLPVSLVVPGQTLNITAVTLDQKFQIGFLALPEAVPELQKLAAYTVEAFAQLKESLAPAAANAPAVPAPKARPVPRKTTRRAASTARTTAKASRKRVSA